MRMYGRKVWRGERIDEETGSHRTNSQQRAAEKREWKRTVTEHWDEDVLKEAGKKIPPPEVVRELMASSHYSIGDKTRTVDNGNNTGMTEPQYQILRGELLHRVWLNQTKHDQYGDDKVLCANFHARVTCYKEALNLLEEAWEGKLGSFTCTECGMVSYHPRDREERYCGNCHKFFPKESYG